MKEKRALILRRLLIIHAKFSADRAWNKMKEWEIAEDIDWIKSEDFNPS